MKKSIVVPFLIVFALLALISVSSVLSPMEPTQPLMVTQVQMSQIEEAIVEFMKDCGQYPDNTARLKVLFEKPSSCSGWRGPYLKSSPKDGWGQPFDYERKEDGVYIWSYGADGKPGGEDKNKDMVWKVGEGVL